jgi:hypothetical protein
MEEVIVLKKIKSLFKGTKPAAKAAEKKLPEDPKK